jgi:hypothetical protein
VALVGFGLDSLIEVTSGFALLWRLHQDKNTLRREEAERLTLRIVGLCFPMLSAYIAYDSLDALLSREAPARSLPGIVIALASLIAMLPEPKDASGPDWVIGGQLSRQRRDYLFAIGGSLLSENVLSNPGTDSPVHQHEFGIHRLGDALPGGINQCPQIGKELFARDRQRRDDGPGRYSRDIRVSTFRHVLPPASRWGARSLRRNCPALLRETPPWPRNRRRL